MSEFNPDAVRNAARVVHEANRAYCVTIGDVSQPPFGEIPYWQVMSIMKGVEAVWKNPYMTPEGSHAVWMYEKELGGWKYGSVKDINKKEHPCMVPYVELSEEQKVKDRLFISIAKSLMPR